MNYSLEKPLVSVRLMTFMHADYISEAIESCLMQKTTFQFEIVIGDDFSTDGTRDICLEYEKKYPDIIRVLNRPLHGDYWQKRQKFGRFYNFLNIVENCRGEYIALLDGDDYWTDSLKIQKQVDFLQENEDYTMCFTRFKIKNNVGELVEDNNEHYFLNQANVIDFDFEKFSKGWHIGTQTVMFRSNKDLFASLKKYKLTRDVHLYTELLLAGKGACLSDFCAIYRVTGEGVHTSQNYRSQILSVSHVYEELYTHHKQNNFLEFKYRKFLKIYLKQVASKKDIFKYLGAAFRSYRLTSNISYLKEDLKYLWETGYSGYKRNKV
ncbi:MAG: glycosyltransferase family 2 protein [Aquaticitalea sp.]